MYIQIGITAPKDHVLFLNYILDFGVGHTLIFLKVVGSIKTRRIWTMKLIAEGGIRKDLSTCDKCIHWSIQGCMMLDCVYHSNKVLIINAKYRFKKEEKKDATDNNNYCLEY